jgi:type IV pilus assembly protein PilQ
VTLEFVDADVRKIFQLLAEVSGKNFVLGDDVNGNISLKLENVPWDQALEVILDTKELAIREEGNIIQIRKKEKFKLYDEKRTPLSVITADLPVTARCQVRNTTAAEILPVLNILLTKYRLQIGHSSNANVNSKSNVNVSAGGNSADASSDKTVNVKSESTYKAEYGEMYPEANTNSIIINDTMNVVNKAKSIISALDVPKKQVIIEARMIEASTSFSKDFGIQWGVHQRDGSASTLGINTIDSGFGGVASSPPTTGTSGPGFSTGISIGTLASNIKLDARLSAAASLGSVKIISSPKIVTSYGTKATIMQGQQIPYTSSTTNTVETKFMPAVLQLDVLPRITPSGNVIMGIEIKNDSVGAGSPPPINTKQARTELIVADQETAVIGGIMTNNAISFDQGVPYLMDVPFFGKLFKSSSTSNVQTELLIFLTPRLIDKDKQVPPTTTDCEIIK